MRGGTGQSVSVVVPAFNAERFVTQALESALSQTLPPTEVVVVDDGSSDRTAELARGIPGVTLIQVQHAGVSVARNIGVAASSGEYIAFLDADDTWDPEKLAKQLAALRADPEAGIAMCRHRYAFEGTIPEWFRGSRDGEAAPACLLIASLIRRSAWDLVGPFDPQLTHGEDGDWFARSADLGVRVVVIDEPLMTYRIHGANASGQTAAVREGVLRTLRESLRRKRLAGGGE